MNSVLPELDVFNLPVFADANIFPMIPPDELAELADDIKENGLNEPLVIGKVGDEWMLIDGRNRLAACKLAGITPDYRIVDADTDKLKSLVWSWNGPRRHLSSSQKAMAYAMMYPIAKHGGNRKNQVAKNQLDERPDLDKATISRARFILKNDREKAELVRDGHPDYPLSKTYDAVKEETERRKQQAELERQKLEQLTALRSEYPDLASLVDEGRIYLDEAIDTAGKRTQKAQEEAERIAHEAAERERLEREAEEAKLAEEERQQREQARQEKEYFEQCLTGFFHQLNQLISGTSVAVNATQLEQLDRYQGYWDRFSQSYRHDRRDVVRVLTALHQNLPTLIKKLETM